MRMTCMTTPNLISWDYCLCDIGRARGCTPQAQLPPHRPCARPQPGGTHAGRPTRHEQRPEPSVHDTPRAYRSKRRSNGTTKAVTRQTHRPQHSSAAAPRCATHNSGQHASRSDAAPLCRSRAAAAAAARAERRQQGRFQLSTAAGRSAAPPALRPARRGGRGAWAGRSPVEARECRLGAMRQRPPPAPPRAAAGKVRGRGGARPPKGAAWGLQSAGGRGRLPCPGPRKVGRQGEAAPPQSAGRGPQTAGVLPLRRRENKGGFRGVYSPRALRRAAGRGGGRGRGGAARTAVAAGGGVQGASARGSRSFPGWYYRRQTALSQARGLTGGLGW
ncbi:MAG: hypothetical protein J3K34DRAFT_522250, partial [Monoraphidium minutum]